MPAFVLLLAPTMFAQQGQYDSPYSGQYAPQAGDQQPGYAQPSYAQPQPQQSYPENAYPDSAYQGPDQSPQQGYGQAQPLSPLVLEQLVAPIALYPDALVAQILAASTYPAQLADADRWRRAQGYAPSEQIAAGADAQNWDPSVKALTAFPQVLAEMDQNLHWASELGDAYYNQPQDVLQAVQIMRRRAQQAGSLYSTPQQAVTDDQGYVAVAPVNPQVVYVPSYNPWAVYGEPVSPYPGFSLLGALGSVFDSSALRFGLGIAMNAFAHTPWGWLGWGLSWLTQSVLFNGSNYFSHSTTVADWGLPHGGPRAFSRGGTFANWSNRSYGMASGMPGRMPSQGSNGNSYGRSFGNSFERTNRTAGVYGQTGRGFEGTRSQGFSRTPERNEFAANRMGEGYDRAYRAPGNSYGRSSYGQSREGFRGLQPTVNRSQSYGRSGYGSSSYGSSFLGSSAHQSGFYNRSLENSGSRASAGRGNTKLAYGAPRENFRGKDFSKHSSHGFSSRSYSNKGFSKPSKHERSGGSHWFGGGHAPKGFGRAKSPGHGHSGGGHSGGKHHG